VKLLVGGLIIALPVSVVFAVVILIAVSGQAAVSAGVGAVIGVAAIGIGQVILTLSRRMDAQITFVIAMGAYVVGVGGAVLAMMALGQSGTLDMFWVAISLIAAALTYTLGMVLAHRRLRILAFEPHQEPTNGPE